MKKIVKINGMHCKSCKSLIEGELSDMECVENVVVSLGNENAEIVMEDGSIDALLNAIEALGFSAQVQE